MQRARWSERVEIGHHSVLPECCAAIEVDVARLSNHLATIVDPIREAEVVSRQGSEISNLPVTPHHGVRRCVTRQIRSPHDLASVIDGEGGVIHQAAQSRQARNNAVLPKYGVKAE